VSQLIAEAIRLERGIDVRCSPLGGLTGISSAAESGADDSLPKSLVSVGTVTRAQLDILLRRLRRSFPRSHIVIGYWDGGNAGPDVVAEEVRCAESVSALVDLVSRDSGVRSPREQTVRHLEAAGFGETSNLAPLPGSEFPCRLRGAAVGRRTCFPYQVPHLRP
jgi:hypothetical protein